MSGKSYQWDAADYAAHSESQLAWAQELINRLNLAVDPKGHAASRSRRPRRMASHDVASLPGASALADAASVYRGAFISQVVGMYLDRHPEDSRGLVHVAMVRLEVEAVKR